MSSSQASLALRFLPLEATAFTTYPALLALGFPVPSGPFLSPLADCPAMFPGISALEGSGFMEVWTSDDPIHYDDENGFATARTDHILCGALRYDDRGRALEDLSFELYSRLFDLIEADGYPHLLRLYNYFAGITVQTDGFERYQRFSLGRHNAFEQRRRAVTTSPAACALGSSNGPFILGFIAAKAPGLAIENPRQVSAYAYPERYGPRSPIFSRGLTAQIAGHTRFFLSGTASIVGHETRHIGDARQQAQETMANINMMRAQATKTGMPPDFPMGFKAYLRKGTSLGEVKPVLQSHLKTGDQLRIVEADICRNDLLLEVDGASLG